MSAPSPTPRFRVRLGPYGTWVVVGSVALTLLATAVTLWIPRYLGEIVDALIGGGLERAALFRVSGLYFAAALVAAVFGKLMRQLPMRLGPRVAHLLRRDLYTHLLRLDDDQVRRHRTGDLMSRLNSDVNAVAEMIALGGHSVIRAGFTLGIAFWVMYQRSASMAGVMSILLPVMIFLGYVLLRSIRKRHTAVQEQLGELTTWCQESFAGIRVVKGMGLESLRADRFRGLNEEYIHRNMALSRIEVPAWPLMHAGFILGNVALLWVGGRQVIEGETSLGLLVEFQQYLMVLQWPTLSLAWTMSLILRGRASLARLRAVTDEQPRLEDGDHTLADSDLSSGGVSFEHVSLTLDGHEALKDVSFSSPKGQLLGITGPTGAGKTMLLNLLLRRYDPSEGVVKLGGVDVRAIPAETLYHFMRLASQEPVLFSMTLGENLRLAKPDATQEELATAMRLSALDADLAELPEGLATRVGERGVTLSGGQRQRCAIARALVGSPELLVLDDSLSAVDTATEAVILDRLLPFLRERTAIFVSHRYAALRACDRVLVLREGRVDQFGPPADLLREPGYFANLEARQRLQAELEALDV